MAANLKAKISLDSSAFMAGIRNVQSRLTSFATSVATVAKSAAKAFGLIALGITGLGIGGMVKMLKKTLDFNQALKASGFEFDVIAKKMRKLSIGIIEGLSPTIGIIEKALNKINFKEVGKQIGDSIQMAINLLVNAFKEGKIGRLASLTLQVGFTEALNYLIAGIQTAVKLIGEAVSIVFSADFFNGLVLGFAGVVKSFQAGLIEALQTPIAFLSAAFDKVTLELAIGMAKALESIAADSPVTKKIFGQIFNSSADLEKMRQPMGKLMEQNRGITGDVSKGLALEGTDLIKQSAGVLSGSAKQWADAIDKAVNNFEPSKLFDNSKLKDELMKMVIDLSGRNIGTESSGENKGTQFKEIEQDRFTRLGLFTGGSGGNSAIGFARRTADNTQKMSEGIKQLVKMNGSKPASANVAVWGE